MSEGVELAELIQQLRSELDRAMREGREEAVKFECGPVELELTVAVEKAAGTGAKVRFWVVDADASAKLGSTRTQRISMTLTPRGAGAPQDPLNISGESVEGER